MVRSLTTAALQLGGHYENHIFACKAYGTRDQELAEQAKHPKSAHGTGRPGVEQGSPRPTKGARRSKTQVTANRQQPAKRPRAAAQGSMVATTAVQAPQETTVLTHVVDPIGALMPRINGGVVDFRRILKYCLSAACIRAQPSPSCGRN